MPLSKKTQLAKAKRMLRKIEEDEPAFRIRIASMSEEERNVAIHWFNGMLQKERKHVKELERSE